MVTKSKIKFKKIKLEKSDLVGNEMVFREAQCLGEQGNYLLGSRVDPNKPHVRRPLIYIFPVTNPL